MGFINKILGNGKKEEKKEEPSEAIDPKYADRICSACEKPGADKSFGGQHWHKKCFRKMKKMARGMM